MTERFENPGDAEIKRLLESVKHIAVLGLSPKAGRPSHMVATALQRWGYAITPVRPAITEVLGRKAYPALSLVPEPIELLDVFRASEYVAEIVDEAIRLKIPAIWLQEGVIDEASALRAQTAGITVVMDLCIYKEYWRLLGS